MESKKINQLATNLAPVSTDLTVVGNPTTGELKKITLLQISSLFGGITSIGMVVPSGFSVSPATLTANGTFTITGAGTTAQYIRGDGSLATFPTFLSSDKLIQEVRNNSGATMLKGTIVYIDGAVGNKATIAKALASSDATSAQTYGVVQDDIANNSNGYIVIVGEVTGLDTSAVTEGQQLYLSGSIAGYYTVTKPYAPIHLVYVAIVLRSHPTLGILGVKIQNGYEMDELHNVSAQSPSNNDGLFYNTTTSLWEKNTIAGVLGYTPVTSARTISTTTPLSGGGDLSANRTLAIAQSTTSVDGYLSATDWTTFNGKQGTITLTTTGTSGAATFISNTLNIPQYSGTNIYNADGTLTGDRILTSGGYNLTFTGSNTAASAIARGLYLIPTLVASANSDVLVGLDINPTFTLGAFTGTTSAAIRVGGSILNNTGYSYNIGSSANPFASVYSVNLISPTTLNVFAASHLYLQAGNTQALQVFSATRNIAIQNGGTFTDGGQRLQVTGTSYFSDSVGIGRIADTDKFEIQGNVRLLSTVVTLKLQSTGSQDQFQIQYDGTWGRFIGVSTTYLAINKSNGNLLLQNGGTFTDGGQRLQVTGTSYFSDSVGIGAAAFSNTRFSISKSLTGSASFFNIYTEGQIQSDVTTANYIGTYATVQNTAFTLSNIRHFYAQGNGSFGSATVTNQYGYVAESSIIGATNNFAFYGNIPSGTGRWNLYMNGTANNYMAGNLLIGSTTDAGYKLDVVGTGRFQDNVLVSKNQNAITSIEIRNTTSGTTSRSILALTSDTNSGTAYIYKVSNTYTTYKISSANDAILYNGTRGDLAIFNDVPALYGGNIKFAAGASSTAQITLTAAGRLLIGTTTENTSALFNVSSTTQGFLPPRMTTTQKNAISSPAAGLMVFDTTLVKLCVYSGTAWETITSL